jgi:hypothetical protein
MSFFAGTINFGPPGGFEGPGTAVLFDTANPGTSFENIISTTIAVMTVVGGIWFFFIFITGAISIISAGGDKGQLETAKKKISNGLTGLVLVLIAVAVLSLVGQILGVRFLDIATFITNGGTF